MTQDIPMTEFDMTRCVATIRPASRKDLIFRIEDAVELIEKWGRSKEDSSRRYVVKTQGIEGDNYCIHFEPENLVA